MPTSRKRKHRSGTAGTRKTAQRKNQTPARRAKASESKHRPKTVRSSNKKRAAAKGDAELLKPGRGRKPATPVINADSDNEIYGAVLSERARRGESKPRIPETKTRNTKSVESKRTPPTGIAKSRTTPTRGTRKKK